MKKNSFSKSGLFNPRALTGLTLCTIGISLTMVSVGARSRTRASSSIPTTSLKPTVINAVAMGESPSVRDLPAAPVTTRDFEHELPPVKQVRAIPDGFVDSVVQTSVSATAAAAPAPIASFEGMTQAEGCGGCIPPDPNGAVGPNQYVHMVNSAFSVYSKSGARLSGPTPINKLFESFGPGNVCHDTNNGDPIVVYDQLADRWLLSQFAFPFDANNNPVAPFDECVAISQGADATGPYYIYDFHLSDTVFHDYPHFGLWPDGYYMSTHEFNASSLSYVGAGVFAFERDKMLNGQPARMIYFDLGTLPAPYNTAFGGHLPSNLDGFNPPPTGAPNYFVEVDSSADIAPNPAALRIWRFHADWSNPANSTFGVNKNPNSTLVVADFARPACSLGGQRVYVSGCVPQLGDPSQIDPIGDRLMFHVSYRNFGDHESLALNHTVVANSTSGQMGPRWYEVRDPGGTPTIAQQSTWGPTGVTDILYRFMGSIAMDRAGDMAIAYSTSSSANFPSIAYAGRLSTDTPSTFGQSETQLVAGGAPQHGELFAPQTGRWGDYTNITVDPVDDCTFWYTDEYYPDPTEVGSATANWHTRIGSFKFSQCTPRPIGYLSGVVTDTAGNPIAGAKVTAGGYTAITAKNGVYQFSPLAPGTYTEGCTAQGYFPASPMTETITNGNTTRQDFALTRNLNDPTPTPTPIPLPLQTVNPPVLNDPGTTITTNSFPLTWSPAEVTSGLTGYVIEESTDYVNPLFDNADGTAQPGQAGSLWNTTASELPNQWTQDPAYHNSLPLSYFVSGTTDGFDTSLTLKSAITVPNDRSSARLTFWSRYFNDPEDTGNIEISTDGGLTWTRLRVLTDSPPFPPGTPPADTRMQNQEVDLTPYRGTPFKVRFRFNTDPVTYFFIRTVGWWVDDINVDGASWHQIGTAGPGATSFNVINKAGGHYYYRVRATYANGTFTNNSNVQDIVVNPPSQLLSAKSRKVHGGAGTYDVDLPLVGPAGIEPRSGGTGGNFEIVYNFQNPITSCGSVSGATGTVTVGTDGKSCVADVSGLPNAQYSTISLQNVTDGTGTFNVSASVGILAGDTTGNGLVNSSDISQTQSQSGQPVGTNNFREDVTVNGAINSSDISFVQAQSGTALP